MTAFEQSLRQQLPSNAVISAPAEIAPFVTDWRGIFSGNAICVVKPYTVEDISKVVKLARAHGVSLVPQGGNTGLAGGATPLETGLQAVISMQNMTSIRKVDREGMTISVEAGCILEKVQHAALDVGRQLPISFASEGSATVGGMISTNAGGINALRYGTVRPNVLGLEVVLSDGTILNGMRSLRKDNSGYDWKQLFIGSEGTLGVISGAVLRMAPVSGDPISTFVSVGTPELAVNLLARLHDRVGDAVTAFELMSADCVVLSLRYCGGRLPVNPSPWYVLFEVAGSGVDLRSVLESTLAEAMEQGTVIDAALSESLAQHQQFWALRENMGEAERLSGRSVKHDIAVPVPDVPSFLKKAASAIHALSPSLKINAFGHVGDGNIHFNILGSESEEMGKRINRAVHDVVLQLEGSIAAEHGIGQYRIAEMNRVRDSSEIVLMKQLKQMMDPENILNPGKVIAR